MYCFKASNIGGIFSTVFPPLENRIRLETLILHAFMVKMHRITTNYASA